MPRTPASEIPRPGFDRSREETARYYNVSKFRSYLLIRSKCSGTLEPLGRVPRSIPGDITTPCIPKCGRLAFEKPFLLGGAIGERVGYGAQGPFPNAGSIVSIIGSCVNVTLEHLHSMRDLG